MHVFEAAKHFGLFGAFVGLLFGIAYSVGGFFVDLATTGLNHGTALAFGALLGMPAIFLAIGAVAGVLWCPLGRRIPLRWGGWADTP